MKQKSGEPLDRWLVRLYDQGASQVRVDAVDSMHFLDLCNDPVVRAEMKTEAEALDGNDSSLLTLIANAVYRRFPDEGLDLCSLTTVTLNPQEVTIMETRVGVQCPPGHYEQICPRSSLL